MTTTETATTTRNLEKWDRLLNGKWLRTQCNNDMCAAVEHSLESINQPCMLCAAGKMKRKGDA